MILRQAYAAVAAYTTKDGSEIRELMHPASQGNAKQSLAEAWVPPGGRTHCHRHGKSEEIYHFTAGEGFMVLGEVRFAVRTGDTVQIPPGTPHWLEAGEQGLRLLCCCSPPYDHGDTELLPAGHPQQTKD